jgi:hypothetical protein
MSEGIPAVFDNGVFRPVGRVDLPDQTVVTVFPSLRAGDGILASAGVWSETGGEFDAWVAELRRWRSIERGDISLPGDGELQGESGVDSA